MNNANDKNSKEIKIRNFVNINIVSRHLFCTICQEVFEDPKRTNCGHTFCLNCLLEWNKKNNQCPICRQKINVEELSRDLVAFNIINDLEVFCANKGK